MCVSIIFGLYPLWPDCPELRNSTVSGLAGAGKGGDHLGTWVLRGPAKESWLNTWCVLDRKSYRSGKTSFGTIVAAELMDGS